MSDPFTEAVAKHGNDEISVEKQQQMGKPTQAALGDEHEQFLKIILKLVDEGKINTLEPMSFVNDDVYNNLDLKLKGKTDQAIPNIVNFLEKIIELHHREEPNDSFEMQNLIESLWQAKQRIEAHADVFIF